MHPRTRQFLFAIFAPLTVPAYILFIVGTNLLGGAFYIVIEATLVRIVGRPITLSRRQMILWAVPVVAAAPVALAALLLLWLGWQLVRFLCWLGHWQTGAATRPWAFAAGLLWTAAAAWTTLSCLNAIVGLASIGRSIEHSRDAFVDFYLHDLPLGELPPDMQQRRQTLIADLRAHRDEVHPQWQELLACLEDDNTNFAMFLPNLGRRLTGLPWFFIPGDFADDGADHCVLLLGPLLFAWMLLVRWPGYFAILKPRLLRGSWFLLRTLGATFGIYHLITWTPRTAYLLYPFAYAGEVPFLFKALSPASWLGVDFRPWVRLEWGLFNAGLWFVLIGFVVFIWWLAWRIRPFLGWPRYYVAFFASRLLQRKRIAFFSVGAVTLCVAMMIIVISVMGGFVDSIRNRAHGLLGDLVMDGGQAGFPFYQEFIDELSALRDEKTGEPLVVQATPLIHSYGILQFPKTKKTKPVRIWGVRFDEYVRVNEFGRDLFYNKRFGDTRLAPTSQPVYGFDQHEVPILPGDMDAHYFGTYLPSLSSDQRAAEEKQYRRVPGWGYSGPGVFERTPLPEDEPGYIGKQFPGVIIGRDVLFRRLASGEYKRLEEYPRGEACMLTMLPLTRGGDISAEPPPKPAFRYIDDSRTGIYEIDSMNVYVDFNTLQRFLTMESQPRTEGQEPYLLTIPHEMESELIAGRVPTFLREQFAGRGVVLPEDAAVSTTKPGQSWRIMAAGSSYLIERTDEGLDVRLGTAGPRCSQIQIKLHPACSKNRQTLEEHQQRLLRLWEDFRLRVPADPLESDLLRMVDVQTWEQMQREYISAIEKEKFLVLIMFGVISVVAVFLILCIFYMIVQEKTRDIGIIKSVGGSAEGVTAVFLAYGAAIGLVGCVLGSLLGITFVEHINDVQDFLARLNPAWRVWSPETYSFDKIPDVWKWSEVLWISVLAIVASIAGAAFPALRAGRTWPVETLRYE